MRMLNRVVLLPSALLICVLSAPFFGAEAQRYGRRNGQRADQGAGQQQNRQRRCLRPLYEGGRCAGQRASHPRQRFWYNSAVQACEMFIWSGCGTNWNNFPTEQACWQWCRDAASAAQTNENEENQNKKKSKKKKQKEGEKEKEAENENQNGNGENGNQGETGNQGNNDYLGPNNNQNWNIGDANGNTERRPRGPFRLTDFLKKLI